MGVVTFPGSIQAKYKVGEIVTLQSDCRERLTVKGHSVIYNRTILYIFDEVDYHLYEWDIQRVKP